MRRLSKKARAEGKIQSGAATSLSTGEDAVRELEEGLFGNGDEEPAAQDVVGAATGAVAQLPEEILDDDEDVDDFIEYADGERPLRRAREVEVSAEMAEAREEAEAIFGTEQEIQELLDFTRGETRMVWPLNCSDRGMVTMTAGSDDRDFEAATGVEEGDDNEDSDRDEDDGFVVEDEDVSSRGDRTIESHAEHC